MNRESVRSPDGAKRNPAKHNALYLPDSAARFVDKVLGRLHPGYTCRPRVSRCIG
jgi:hypothetical protein